MIRNNHFSLSSGKEIACTSTCWSFTKNPHQRHRRHPSKYPRTLNEGLVTTAVVYGPTLIRESLVKEQLLLLLKSMSATPHVNFVDYDRVLRSGGLMCTIKSLKGCLLSFSFG